MSENPSNYYNLAQRIEETFAEIDNDAMMELSECDDAYIKMKEKVSQLTQSCPIEYILDGSDSISLTADEHKTLTQYINLMREMENIERRHIYFRGHTDCFSYLKKIGAI